MFYYISGKIALLNPNTAVIDAGGVGYKMTISQNTYEALPHTMGENAKLFTYLAVREDGIELFGFANEQELNSFKLLITVSGVGPKVALSVLSYLTPEKFALAVCTEDTRSIAKANGVGSKTAARIILELKDKMMKENGDKDLMAWQSKSASAPTGGKGKLSEATDALLVLGYTRAEAMAVLKDVPFESMELEEVIRTCLKKLMKP